MLKFEGVKKHYKDFELNLTMVQEKVQHSKQH